MSQRLIVGCAMVLCAALPASADAPTLEAGVHIQDGGTSLPVVGFAAPEVVDWNNDGKKDLLVGQYGYGKVLLFLNQGTDSSPAFSGASFIQCAGSDIQVGWG